MADHNRAGAAAAPDFASGTRNAVLVLILATGLLRIVFAGSLGLVTDESYAVATSRQLQMSYFDHPPLTWWLTWAMRAITGSEAAIVVRLPFIAAFALTTWFTYSLARVLYGLRAGFWAAVGVNIAPVIGWTTGSWVLPDGPLYTALMGGTYAVARVLFVPKQSPLLWLAAGIAAGLAMLSKLHGVFLLAGVFVFLLSQPRYRWWLASPWPYAGALLALMIFAPVLIWNAQHDWISFAFQASRGQAQRLSPVALLVLLGGQMAYLLPLLWATLVFLWMRAIARGPGNPRDWLLVCVASGPIIVFTVTGLWAGKILPHWAMPGFVMLMPLLGRELARGIALGRRWVAWWLGLCVGTTALLIATAIALALLPWPTLTFAGKPLSDPLIETISWRDFAHEMDNRGLTHRDNIVFAALRWHEAGKMALALGPNAPVLCLCDDPRGFGVNIRSLDYLGKDVLLAGRNLNRDVVLENYGRYFDSISEQAPLMLRRAGKPTLEIQTFLGTRLHRSTRQPDLLDALHMWSAKAR